jgi:hypothetical protein
MLSLDQIEVFRKAYANATCEQITEDRNKAARLKAHDSAEVLHQILLERLAAEDGELTPTAWAETVAPKKKPLTAKEKREKEERRIERETRNGRDLPRPREPHAEFTNQTEYDLFRASTAPPPVSPYACIDCRENYRAPTCTGHCDSPRFFESRRMSRTEYAAFLASQRGPKD